MTAAKEEISPLQNAHNTTWVKERNSRSGYCFFGKPVVVEANIDKVWELAKDVKRYKEVSHGAVAAHIEGAAEEGKTILLDLYPDECKGKFIPQSKETISVVDAEKKIIGWERHLPLTAEPTQRYQILEPISEHQTCSYIGLRVPGLFGFFTQCFLKETVEDSFTALNEGIKEELETKGALI